MLNKILSLIIIYFYLALTAKAEKPVDVFDSTKNFLGENGYLYKGQKLYVKPLNDDLKQFGYSGFILDYKIDKDIPENIYYPDGNNHTKYDRLFGKYFQVIDAIKPITDIANYGMGHDFAFKLINLSNNDTLYFIYQGEFEHTFPFIVDGYYQKQKKLAVGKKFVFKDELIATAVDLEKGILIEPKTGEVWTCSDIKIDDAYSSLSVIFQNTKGKKIASPIEPTLGAQREWKTYSKAEADKYIKEFGKAVYYNILKGIVTEGMTNKMCAMALGVPKDKKEATVGKIKKQVCIYNNGQTLTFENGILKVIK